jgi:hypothetical protein
MSRSQFRTRDKLPVDPSMNMVHRGSCLVRNPIQTRIQRARAMTAFHTTMMQSCSRNSLLVAFDFSPCAFRTALYDPSTRCERPFLGTRSWSFRCLIHTVFADTRGVVVDNGITRSRIFRQCRCVRISTKLVSCGSDIDVAYNTGAWMRPFDRARG